VVDTGASAQSRELTATARRLWRGSFRGMLSSHSTVHPGYPFGSMLPFCLDQDGLPLMLLSHLAQHSKNLLENPACGLLLWEDTDADPQQSTRLSVIGDCHPLEMPLQSETERYFRYFPQTRPYFEQLNFRFFRLRPRQLHINAGFAAARWLGADRVIQAREIDADTETDWRTRLETQKDDLQRLVSPTDATGMTIAGIDAAGMDLRLGERLMRLQFPTTIGHFDDLSTHLRRS